MSILRICLRFKSLTLLSLTECGIENLSKRIINGHEVIKGRYPWFVRLNGCGGSLITDRHVLTSAHCVPQATQASNQVVLGVHNASDYSTNRPLEVEKFILHEGYKKNVTRYNDIAIIKLKRPIKFSNRLSPICLPDFEETDNLFAYGLGRQNQNGQIVTAKVLHEVELDRISQEQCSKYFKDSRWNLDYNICTLNDKKNTAICFGDSGSPLSTRKDGQVYQVGTVSVAPNHCNVAGQVYPNAYEKVVEHLDWIRKHTQDGKYCEGTHHPFSKPRKTWNNRPSNGRY